MRFSGNPDEWFATHEAWPEAVVALRIQIGLDEPSGKAGTMGAQRASDTGVFDPCPYRGGEGLSRLLMSGGRSPSEPTPIIIGESSCSMYASLQHSPSSPSPLHSRHQRMRLRLLDTAGSTNGWHPYRSANMRSGG